MKQQYEGRVTEYGGPQRLRVGDVVDLFGGKKIVVLVNQSRAVLSSVTSRKVAFTDTASGKPVGFNVVGTETASISPESDVRIERRLGPEGVAYWRANKCLPE